MSTKKKRVAPPLAEDVKLKRQERAYQLHCRGLTIRAIAAEMRLDTTQVLRAIRQAKDAIRAEKGAEHLADLADRLTEGGWSVIARGWDDMEQARAAEDWKAVAQLGSLQAKMRELIARFNGLDPHKVAELEMKRQELALKREALEAQRATSATSADLLQQLADGLLCGVPEGPER